MYCKLINICNVFNFAVRNREKLSTNINLFEILKSTKTKKK